MPRLLAGSNVYIYVGYLYDREINAAVFPSSHFIIVNDLNRSCDIQQLRNATMITATE
ncbi:hypothetical protein BU23DRAFT_322271 [Bimuria novae-zelandiae CBS 107.79]|uniref:Uncharacterized protein n=1 Tax=Bimuria novae-zelandiae CBS 107.79 TaxID=1447943 RepID=A0A6A5VJI5_9PLEO|nr:hypothetical protein BU23DRAFT_322271 [Bimuria novae-zelandiae CBS 107.79]